MRPYVTGGPLSGLVEVRTADATLNDLKTAQSDATTIAIGFGIRVESQVDVIENRVKLFVVDKAGLDSPLAASSVQLPSKVNVVTVSQLSRITTDLYGGLTLSPCTAGYSVTHSDGRQGITSAAHCGQEQTFNGTDLDFVQALLGGKYDVQWHEAPGFTLRNLVYDGSGNRYVYGTESVNDQTVGEYVCKYGITTGFDCGDIVAIDFQPTDQTGCSNYCSFSATFIRVHKDGVDLADVGDSGGPWFSGNTAYGIMRSEFGDDAIYMQIDYTSGLDVSVLQGLSIVPKTAYRHSRAGGNPGGWRGTSFLCEPTLERP